MAKYKNIIFDFDSTLVTVEGLDELARRSGHLEKIKHITDAGMDGKMGFSVSLKKRFDLISPTLDDINFLVDLYSKSITKGAADLIGKLQTEGSRVFIATGGIKAAVLPIALKLGIKSDHLYAVCTILGENNKLILKSSCLMTGDFGKVEVAKLITKTGTTAMIGDGMTDFEAGRHTDKFIGFGGIVERERVKSLSETYVTEASLFKLLDLC